MTETRARSFNITMCDDPHCQAVHIQLCDGAGDVFAGLTIGVDHVDQTTADIKAVAEKVRAKVPPPEKRQ